MDNYENEILYTKEEYANAFETELSKKYGESFKVLGVGGAFGTNNNSTIKAWCCAENGEYENVLFFAEIDKYELSLEDSYINLFVEKKLNDSIMSSFDKDVENLLFCFTKIEDIGKYCNSNDYDLSFDEYLSQVPGCFATSYVFLQDTMDTVENKAMTVHDIAIRISGCDSVKKLKHHCVITFFVSNYSQQDAQEIFYFSKNKYDDYIANESVNSYTGFQTNYGRLNTSYDRILKDIGGSSDVH